MKSIAPLFLYLVTIVVCEDKCNLTQSSCHECIQAHPDCSWDFGNHDEGQRCSSDTHRSYFEHVHFPDNVFRIHKRDELSDSVLVTPQHIQLLLRPHLSFSFDIEFKNEEANNLLLPNLENLKIQATSNETLKNRIEVEITRCPSNSSLYRQTLRLLSQGTNQSVQLDIEFICTCVCEQPHLTVRNAPQCNQHGTYQCGICKCQDGRSGRHCECSGPSDPAECVNHGTVCSSRGSCICGICECEMRENPDERIFGKYCECDNFSCPRAGGLLCGGPDQGTCVCGVCECESDWQGENCASKK